MRCPKNKGKLEKIYEAVFGPNFEIAEFGKGYTPGEDYAWEVSQPPVRLWIEDWEPIWRHSDFSGRDMRRILGNFVAIATQFKDFYDRDALDPFIATDTGRKFFEHIKLAWENYLKILQLHETENKDSDVCRKIIETFEQATDIANVLSSEELWRLYDLDSDEWYEVGETPQETEKANQETRDWVERNCRNVD